MFAAIRKRIEGLRFGDLFTVSGEIVFLLVVFLTTLALFTGADQRNFVVIAVLAVIPVLLVFQFPFLRTDEWPIYVFAISLLFTVFLHRDMARPATLLYSYLFIAAFLFLIRLLQENLFHKDLYLKLLKIIIFAYAIVLFIQQFCVITGLPVLNRIVVDATERFKLNSLAPEPTYSAVVLPLLMFSYMRIRELDWGRKYNFVHDGLEEGWLWLAFSYPMLTMGSGTAFIALILIVLYLMDFSNWRFALVGLALFALVIFALDYFKVEAYIRALNFLKVVFTFDPYLILVTDHSASFRVVPSILYLRMFDVTSLNTWLGHGIDFDVAYFPEIIPGLEDENGAGGIFPTFVMNFGVLSAVALLVMIRKFCLRRWWSFETLFWLVLVSVWGLNNQFAWAALFILACNKYFFDQYKSEKQKASGDLHPLAQ